jgi:hypothetical protein
MSDARQPAAELSPLANVYLLAGLTAVAVLGAVFVRTGGRWGLVPALVGAAGLAFQWRPAPLVAMAGIVLAEIPPFGPIETPWLDLSELMPRRSVLPANLAAEAGVCATMAIYVIAHYRLIGLTAGVFPPDPRADEDRFRRRNATAAEPDELVSALFSAATATVGAFFLWRVLQAAPVPWDIVRRQWQLGVLAWLLIGAAAVTAAVLGHLGWRRLSRLEAAVFLQDALWHETRREQRRINRWRAWSLRRR